MKASIVIPAHNEEKSIAATLQAVLAQNHPDFEVIVVDNASSDRTAEVARKFSSARVVHEPRKGLLSARERGRKEAKGDIIVNIDADCLPDPDWLSRGLAHFRRADVVAVTGPYDYHDAGRLFRSASLLSQKHIYRTMGVLLQLPFIRAGAVLIGGNNFIRADILERVGGYDVSVVFYGEDTDTADKIFRHGRVVFNPTLTLKTSARRFKAEGTAIITAKYLYYFFRGIFMSQYKNRKKKPHELCSDGYRE